MSEHDPLCPWRDNWVGMEGHECEMCALIAKVAERIALAIEAMPANYQNLMFKSAAVRVARNGGRDA